MQNKKNDFIFGIHPVIEALEAGKTLDKVFIQNRLQGENINELKALLAQNGVRPHYVPVEKLNRFTRKNHQGVVAFISEIPFYKIEDIIPELYEEGKTPLILLLDGVTDVRNFGAICRTAECTGVDAVIISDRSSAPVNADAIKTSAGALFNLKICKEPNYYQTINFLKNSGLKIIAATEKTDNLIYEGDFKSPVCLVMGDEETGVSPDVLKITDQRVKLPMTGKTESLNVSVACGAVLYEAVRQRLQTTEN